MSNLPECYLFCDQDTFDPVDYFIDYHYYEKFDQSKTYTHKCFRKNYGHGELTYKYTLYILSDNEKYIVAERDISTTNPEELIPYCRCLYHSLHPLNPLRLFKCYLSIGCVDSPFPDQSIIDASKIYMEEQNNNQRKRAEIIRRAKEIIITHR